MEPAANGQVSYWYRDLGGLPPRRAGLAGDSTADVAIIGAGYTGLWTAYYLKKAQPALDILVIEKDFAGFGASGRNGGWASGSFIWNRKRYLDNGSRDDVRAMIAALAQSPAEIARVCREEAIDCDLVETEELLIATNSAQQARLEADFRDREAWQVPEEQARLIGRDETLSRLAFHNATGAMAIGGVARVQPAKLVRGLSSRVEALGVRIVEGTEVTDYQSGLVRTKAGTVRAPVIIRATEGFTATMPGLKRQWLPLNSAQVVTTPLSDAQWRAIGWNGCEIVGDYANVYCYAQRTRDGRITMGGRGVPYRFGSAIDTSGEADRETIRRLIATLHRHFPILKDQPIDHAWAGVLGVPRDWCTTIGFDRATGLGHAGGYVGVGVATSNIAGRTLADLVTGADTRLARLPWVNRSVRTWESEPLRFVGVNGMYKLYAAADRQEDRTGRPSPLAALGNALTGR